jgi:hypothetical protein
MRGLMPVPIMADCVVEIYKGDYSLYAERIKRISFNAKASNESIPDPLEEARSLLAELTKQLYIFP